MRIKRVGPLLVLCGALCSTNVNGQQNTAPQAISRDSQAVGILQQCVAAAGGAQAISAIQDFTGTGTITYYWAKEQVQGNVTVRGRGLGQFRMDASVPNGTQSWIVDDLSGTLVTPDGKSHRLSPYNLINAGSLTIPELRIAAAVNDPEISISYVGQVTIDGRQAYEIAVAPPVDSSLSSLPGLGEAGSFHVFIDSLNYQVLKQSEILHGERRTNQTFTEELNFSNYKPVNGILIPYSTAEQFAGQPTWSITLSSISFNTALTDSDFSTASE